MTSSLQTYWRSMAKKETPDLSARLLTALLIPFSIAYAISQQLRSWLYLKNILRKKHLPRPVLSVGNITVGGTGKTPVTIYIASYLMEKGYRVAVLSRGYGGTLEGKTAVVSNGKQLFYSAEECGDEPFLLARTLPGLMVVIGTDRHAAGILAMETLNPDVFLLDDGYQHLRLHRDLNILLLDDSSKFGNGWTLPAGLLREPLNAVRRSDLVILTRCTSAENKSLFPRSLQEKQKYRSRHVLVDAVPLNGGDLIRLEALQNKKVLAFAGIAEPEFFFDGLLEKKLMVTETLSFADHAAYDEKTIALISRMAETSGADYLVTTEKDGVKLKLLPETLRQKTVLARLELRFENAKGLRDLLDLTMKRGRNVEQQIS